MVTACEQRVAMAMGGSSDGDGGNEDEGRVLRLIEGKERVGVMATAAIAPAVCVTV